MKTLNDLRRNRGVRGAQLVVVFTELIVTRAEILRVGYDMEYFPPPERTAIVGSHCHDQTSVQDRVELDGEWEYQQIYEGPSGYQPTGTCASTGCPSSPLDSGVK